MKKDVSVYIDDMLEAISAIERYVAGMDEVKFSQRKFLRSYERNSRIFPGGKSLIFET